MTTVEVLKAARERVAGGWTRGILRQQNENGSMSYCASGALEHSATHNLSSSPTACVACRARSALDRATGSYSLVAWNDAHERTQAEVLAAFDKAILLAEAESKPGAAAS